MRWSRAPSRLEMHLGPGSSPGAGEAGYQGDRRGWLEPPSGCTQFPSHRSLQGIHDPGQCQIKAVLPKDLLRGSW